MCLDLAEISELTPNQQSHKDSCTVWKHYSRIWVMVCSSSINSLRAATNKCNYTVSRVSSELSPLPWLYTLALQWTGRDSIWTIVPLVMEKFNSTSVNLVLKCLYAYVCVASSLYSQWRSSQESQGHLAREPVHAKVDTYCWVSWNVLQALLSTSIRSPLTTIRTWISGLKAGNWMQAQMYKDVSEGKTQLKTTQKMKLTIKASDFSL